MAEIIANLWAVEDALDFDDEQRTSAANCLSRSDAIREHELSFSPLDTLWVDFEVNDSRNV
jgi:hypothetical protein